MDGDFEYIADTFLLERTFRILAEVDSEEGAIQKQAQIFGLDLKSILSSIGSSIKSTISGLVGGKDSHGAGRTVLNILAPGVFFKIHPILGILLTGAQMFGFDLVTIFQGIVNTIAPSILEGKPVSAAEVNEAAQATGLSAAGGDFLHPLRELESRGMTKMAVRGGGFGSEWRRQNFLPKDKSPLVRAFSFLGRRRGSSIIVGIMVWFIKTILLSAGLLLAGGAVAGMFKDKTKDTEQADQTEQTEQTGQAIQTPQPSFGIGVPAPTGAGSTNYRPNPSDLWVEILRGQKPYERVLQWTFDSYPDLYQYQDIILRTPSFWSAVSKLTENWMPGDQQWSVPAPYKTRDEVLSLFINDVYRTLNQTRGS